ncbi:MAG: 3-dehydroquinate synthase [Lentisphaerae bacterium]|nr:3-dehydroquinate synthase [Lentisphaerota bacterium]
MPHDKVRVELGRRSYNIEIGEQLLDKAVFYKTEHRKVLIVADANTAPLYMSKVTAGLTASGATVHSFVIEPGEQHKTFATVEKICCAAVKAGLDRRSLMVALGGGVTGDLTGFAAAVYMRGIGFIQVPTSLLAMVDSSVGGKTGADLPEGKNLVGAFHQPEQVIIDIGTLDTLPPEELRNGTAEVIKYGVIMDSELFAQLETVNCRISREIIARCCGLKARIVAEDETEGGIRAILNYGHTFGHAVELLSNFQLSHGCAIAVGMAMAGQLAVAAGLWDESDNKRQQRLLETAGLPVRVSGFKPADIWAAMGRDKKKSVNKLTLVVPVAIGKVELHNDLDKTMILEVIGSCCD